MVEKRKMMLTVKSLVVDSLGLGKDEQVEHGGSSGQWKYLVGHRNDGNLPLDIRPNP